MSAIGRIMRVPDIGIMVTNGCGCPGIGASIIDGFMGLMSAVASSVANTPGNITGTTITIMMNIITTSTSARKLERRKAKGENRSACGAVIRYGEWSELGSRDIGYARGARVREQDAIESIRAASSRISY